MKRSFIALSSLVCCAFSEAAVLTQNFDITIDSVGDTIYYDFETYFASSLVSEVPDYDFTITVEAGDRFVITPSSSNYGVINVDDGSGTMTNRVVWFTTGFFEVGLFDDSQYTSSSALLYEGSLGTEPVVLPGPGLGTFGFFDNVGEGGEVSLIKFNGPGSEDNEYGWVNLEGGSITFNSASLEVAPVPEPSVSLLVAIAGLAVFKRRRR